MSMVSSSFQADDPDSSSGTRSRLPELDPSPSGRTRRAGRPTRHPTLTDPITRAERVLIVFVLALLAALAFTAESRAAIPSIGARAALIDHGSGGAADWPSAGDPAGPRATSTTFQRGVASSYGPGLFGNRTACGQALTPSTRGAAHRTLPCGTRLQICRAGRCTHARVIDRGPFISGRVLDLTARTTRELCSCSPYVWGYRVVAYRRKALG